MDRSIFDGLIGFMGMIVSFITPDNVGYIVGLITIFYLLLRCGALIVDFCRKRKFKNDD